jgi:hypothetical protein
MALIKPLSADSASAYQPLLLAVCRQTMRRNARLAMTVQIGRMPRRRCCQLLIVREPGQTRLQAQPFYALEFRAGVRWQPGADCNGQGDGQDAIAGLVHSRAFGKSTRPSAVGAVRKIR